MPSHKPADHPAVSPYLRVADARGMLAFLAATFGAQELHRRTREDGSVMHAEVRIDDSVVMLGERPGDTATPSASTHVYVPDVDACHTACLAAGAIRRAICGGSAPASPADLSSPSRRSHVRHR